MTQAPPKPIRFGDLGIRVASGLVLAAIAFLNVWLGGYFAVVLVIALLVTMLWEYHGMVTGDRSLSAPAFLALALGGAAAVIATDMHSLAAGLALLAIAGLAAGMLARPHMAWLLAGSLYLGGAMCMLIVLGGVRPGGFAAILWLVFVVVASDVGAYFTGRLFGGRKLWPRVSPGKTWAGCYGGLAFAGVVGLVFALVVGWSVIPTTLLSLLIGAASQAGDLLESAVKRHFGLKDASQIMPGHGGVMDRLDGILGAAWFMLAASVFGLAPGTG